MNLSADPRIDSSTLIRLKQAWLITWDWLGDHAKVDEKVVAILNYRRSGHTIRKVVEQIYMSRQYSLHEQASYAKNKKRSNYYPAQFSIIDGGRFIDQIHCGDNPFLWARRVFDLEAYVDENCDEHLTWDEYHYEKANQKPTCKHFHLIKDFTKKYSLSVTELGKE